MHKPNIATYVIEVTQFKNKLNLVTFMKLVYSYIPIIDNFNFIQAHKSEHLYSLFNIHRSQ